MSKLVLLRRRVAAHHANVTNAKKREIDGRHRFENRLRQEKCGAVVPGFPQNVGYMNSGDFSNCWGPTFALLSLAPSRSFGGHPHRLSLYSLLHFSFLFRRRPFVRAWISQRNLVCSVSFSAGQSSHASLQSDRLRGLPRLEASKGAKVKRRNHSEDDLEQPGRFLRYHSHLRKICFLEPR